MRVLLIQSKSISSGEPPLLPLGLCYIGTALANNRHEVIIYDTNTKANPIPELKRLIRNTEPDIVGVGLRNIDIITYSPYVHYVQPFSELVSTIKEIAPKTKILAGGTGFSIFGQQLMERLPDIDFGILNEGEETVPDLLNNLDHPQSVKGIFLRNSSTVLFTGARKSIDFALFPAPRRDFLDLGPYLEHPHSIGVQTKRGCRFNCAYCTSPYLQGTEVRMRSPDKVLDELELLAKEYDLRSFFFVDSIFNVPQSHAREILDGMLSRGLEFNWRGFDELKYFDTEYCKLAKAAGCNYFQFSPDGISRSTLTGLNKVTSVEDIERGYSIIKNNERVKVCFTFFINSPGESLTNIIRLVIFTIRCKFTLRKKLDIFRYDLIRIYPNTAIYNLALQKGIIKPGDDLIRSVYYDPPPWKYMKYAWRLFRPTLRVARYFYRVLKKIIRSF